MGRCGGNRHLSDAHACARLVATLTNQQVCLALPIGLGKATAFTNALYRLACDDSSLQLTIITALTLEVPVGHSELERRYLEPIVERLYSDVPRLDYATALREGRLPDNVQIVEFYLRPGAYLDVAAVQRNYASINYAHAARDLVSRGVNVVAQQVACESLDDGSARYSLSCNPDVTLDLLDASQSAGAPRPLLIGELNAELPFMEGDAVVDQDAFDVLLDMGEGRQLFPVPAEPVSLAQHAIAVRASTLISDGGSLQIGIGGVGDALTHALLLRHVRGSEFRALAAALDIDKTGAHLGPFTQGLYAATEMFVEGLLHLRNHGVLKRRAGDGRYLHAGFFLGSARFYQALRELQKEDRDGIGMCRISFTNRLLGDEARKRRDRVHARFMNSAMMVTLGGAVVADGLENGRVVSGVGGQFDFVAMAHELEGARSVIMLPATRTVGGRVSSNIVWQYAHQTIPRHLRDLVVTEYGVADLRGRSDDEVIQRLLEITDSRFQEGLRKLAVRAGKLSSGFRIASRYRENTPERLNQQLARAGVLSLLPFFPLGTDFTDDEATLAVALGALDAHRGHWLRYLHWGLEGLKSLTVTESSWLHAPLARLGLHRPASFADCLKRALVTGTLMESYWRSGRPLV